MVAHMSLRRICSELDVENSFMLDTKSSHVTKVEEELLVVHECIIITMSFMIV